MWDPKNDYAKIMKSISTDYIYTFSSPCRQSFSLPPNIIYNIFNQRKSPFFLLKLYKTCKYFFHKRQILPIIFDDGTSCYGKEVYSFSECTFWHFNINPKILFWCHNSLICGYMCQTVYNRIYSCTSLKEIYLNRCELPLDLFEKFTANSVIEKFDFQLSKIIYSNGSTVPLNVILEMVPNSVQLIYQNDYELLSKETLIKLNELKRPKKFERIEFWIVELAENFSLNFFCNFIAKNLSSNSICKFYICSCKLLEAEVKKCFDSLLIDWKEKPEIMIHTVPSNEWNV